MSKLEHAVEMLKLIPSEMRSYAKKEHQPSDDDHHEALGLALFLGNILHEMDHEGADYSFINDDTSDDSEKRSFAEAGKILAPSRKNPHVRRWIAQHAQTQLARRGALHGAMAVNAPIIGNVIVHHMAKDKVGHSSYWHKHHKEFVDKVAKSTGHHPNTIAHALAAHGVTEQQRNTHEAFWGKAKRLGKDDIARKAKSKFISGMIKAHKQGKLKDMAD